MSDSPTNSPRSTNTHQEDPKKQQIIPINQELEPKNLHKIHGNNDPRKPNEIPVEIVSEEEMAFLEAALALARPSLYLSSSAFPSSCLSLLSTQLGRNSKRESSTSAGLSSVGDVEDSGGLISPKKKLKVPETFLSRFRRKKGLYVTDLTATEWCEKQMEFILRFGKPESTPAMKAGATRHAKLEEEVIKKVEVRVESLEDIWALKFMNFIICGNQLLFEGLTREVPVVGLVQGVWMVGVIDELRMPIAGKDRHLTLVDTKTRVRPKLPTEAQGRNGRLQLMSYKHLWDNLVSEKFPCEQFFDYFSLDPQYFLSEEIKRIIADSDFSAQGTEWEVRLPWLEREGGVAKFF